MNLLKILNKIKSISPSDRSKLERALSRTPRKGDKLYKSSSSCGSKGTKDVKSAHQLPNLESGGFLDTYLFVLKSIKLPGHITDDMLILFLKTIKSCYEHLIDHHGITGGSKK